MWTKEQLEAINSEGNLLVSAAAGAGKTAVMTERIARIISEGTRVEELLVVTFTKPAAAEMKQRIETRLIDLSESEKDQSKKRFLTEAAAGVSGANISTIHSFCTNVLKRNYHIVGLDPAFRVGDDAETALLRKKAMDELMEEFYLSAEKEEDEVSDFLIRTFGENDGIESILLSIYSFIIARPQPIEWLKKAAAAYGKDFYKAQEKAGEHLIGIASRDLKVFMNYADRVNEENRGILTGDDRGFLSIVSDDRQSLFAFTLYNSYESWQRNLDGFRLKKMYLKKGLEAPDSIKKYRKQLSDLLSKKIKPLFKYTLEEEEKAAAAIEPVLEKLCALEEGFMERYAALKQQEAIIDYSDMEQLTLLVLSNEDAAEEYRQRFKYIFIDEYQDTNLVQDSIISRISRGNNLFMVGDVKQSIYRFRQAEPASFLQKYRSYEGKTGKRIDLNHNFRSNTAILNAANKLFSQLMLGEVGEIDYSDNAALRPGEGREQGSVELALIELSPDIYREKTAEDDDSPAPEENGAGETAETAESEEQGAFEELESVEAEAAYIADRIHELMRDGSVIDKEKGEKRKPK
ncbi:MAG: UvrD-helicase domain-containing protein, partial [Clostridia bacterium]|nr:UvrD-helicase domain-containing protein [Clostridia bacterium]